LLELGIFSLDFLLFALCGRRLPGLFLCNFRPFPCIAVFFSPRDLWNRLPERAISRRQAGTHLSSSLSTLRVAPISIQRRCCSCKIRRVFFPFPPRNRLIAAASFYRYVFRPVPPGFNLPFYLTDSLSGNSLRTPFHVRRSDRRRRLAASVREVSSIPHCYP